MNLFRPSLPNPLGDVPYERYMRLVGLYNTIPAETRQLPPFQSAAKEFEALRDELKAGIDPERANFKTDDASDRVHNLHLLLLQIVPRDYLAFLITPMREEYREAVGDASYQLYTKSAPYEALSCETFSNAALETLARADAAFLANETRRYQLMLDHVEGTRRYLMNEVTRFAVLLVTPLSGLILSFFLFERLHRIEHPAQWVYSIDWVFWDQNGAKPSLVFKTVEVLTMLSIAGISGAAGAYVSVLNRIQSLGGNSHVARNVVALRNADMAVRLAPLAGLIFALVLTFILAAGLVSGSLFPRISGFGWYCTMYSPGDLAKWVVWSFIAGFSERLVPDMLDRLTAKSRDDDKPGFVSPASAGKPAPGMILPPSEAAEGGGAGLGSARPPAAPGGVSLTREGLSVRARWQAVEGAVAYAPYYQVTGRDAAFLNLPLETGLDILLDNLPTTGTLRFYLQARNSAGDSPKSDVAEIDLAG